MKDVAVKWKDVGIQLLSSGSTLDIIEKSHHNVSHYVPLHAYELASYSL